MWQLTKTQTTTRSSIANPGWLNGNVYTKEDEVPTTAVIWSPCGAEGILNVNNRISLAANTTAGTGELTNDDATISFEHQVHVSWQACTYVLLQVITTDEGYIASSTNR
jgi:hypothetical protein